MRRLIAVIFFVVTLLCSCSKYEPVHDPVTGKQVRVMFSPGGIGDMGYNDLILAGFQRLRKDRGDVGMVFLMPDSLPQARRILTGWLDGAGTGKDELFVLASSDYESMLSEVLEARGGAGLSDNRQKQILLMESSNPDSLPVHTLRISIYGASYLAGISAAEECGSSPALVMAANPHDKPVLSAVEGFIDGWTSACDSRIDTVCMATDWTGFIKYEEAYSSMGEWSKKYGFVFPVAGGTNNGIYKYLRENPSRMKTAGMDVDQSYLCSDIIGSVLKHIDRLVYDTVSEWIDTGDIQAKPCSGLADGYSEWLSDSIADSTDIKRATELERDYEEGL